MANSEPKLLKDIFDEQRLQRIGADVAAVWAPFDTQQFLAIGLDDHANLTLLQRLRQISRGLRATLPSDYLEALQILNNVATRTEKGFVSLFLPDFVGQYGLGHFEASMQALKTFTKLGSAEFAVREFLRVDLLSTLEVMTCWSMDGDEHVRRLASEGSRPRLPWSFKLQAIIDGPELTLPILLNLAQDPSLYVRKSVANHLNDVSKDHPEWLLNTLEKWPNTHPHSTWIKKRAMRTLVKAGNQEALAQLGAAEAVAVAVRRFEVSPAALSLGDKLTLSVELLSQSEKPQRLVIDYVIHYVKKAGSTSPKVFKMKELTLEPYGQLSFKRLQHIKDFSTRTHYRGQHLVELMVNGKCLARSSFEIVS